MSAPGQFDPSPQPPKSGGGGMSVLMIILIVGGILLLLCAGICGGCVLLAQRAATEVGSAIELSSTYDDAMQAACEDPGVIEKLGDPVAPASVPLREGSGELKPAGETFKFEVSGPKGKATVIATAKKEMGVWRLTAITAQAPDGTTIDVPAPEPQGPNIDLSGEMPEMPNDEK